MFTAVLLLQQQRVPAAAESSSLWLRPPTACNVSNKDFEILTRRALLFYFFNSDNDQSPEAWTNQLSGQCTWTSHIQVPGMLKNQGAVRPSA